ncbi:MAG: helix-turn-helix domain-containing protein [Finegoldia magna]
MENAFMSLFERIKSLAKAKNKNVKQVALELGFSENLFYKWKTNDPKAKDLEKVAEYFNVSVDYLLGRELKEAPKKVDLSEDDTVFSFDGKEISKETMRKAIAIAKALEENE